MINFKNKRVLVFGLGLLGGGVAVTRFLLDQGAKVTVVDKKNKTELKSSLSKLKKYRIKYFFATDPGRDFLDYDFILKNPGVAREHPFFKLAMAKKIPIYNEASLFFLFVDNPIIAITGSKGKSTTTDLVGKIIKASDPGLLVGGNIQTTTMFALFPKIKSNSRIVLELSSWHLEGMPLIKKSPKLAVITNILPEHLNRYRNFKDYAKAKEIILKYQKNDDMAVLNYDNSYCRDLSNQAKAKVYWFGIEDYKKYKKLNGVFIKNGWLVWQTQQVYEKIISVKSVKLAGKHNLSNILAAVCVAKLQGVVNPIIKKVVTNYKGLSNRLEFIRKVKGISFYNDTTATAPVATVAALTNFPKSLILLAGGSDKKLPVEDLAKVINLKTKYCLLFKGKGSDRLIKALIKIKYPKDRLMTGINSMPEMISRSLKLAKAGDIILLSPGFSSFSNFANEFDRGQQFVKGIRKI